MFPERPRPTLRSWSRYVVVQEAVAWRGGGMETRSSGRAKEAEGEEGEGGEAVPMEDEGRSSRRSLGGGRKLLN